METGTTRAIMGVTTCAPSRDAAKGRIAFETPAGTAAPPLAGDASPPVRLLPRRLFRARDLGGDAVARHWIKLYISTGRAAASVLPDRELAALVRLALHTRYRDNTIRAPDTGEPASTEQIAAILGKSMRQTKEILSALVARGALRRERQGKRYVYQVSELLFYRGGRVQKNNLRRRN